MFEHHINLVQSRTGGKGSILQNMQFLPHLPTFQRNGLWIFFQILIVGTQTEGLSDNTVLVSSENIMINVVPGLPYQLTTACCCDVTAWWIMLLLFLGHRIHYRSRIIILTYDTVMITRSGVTCCGRVTQKIGVYILFWTESYLVFLHEVHFLIFCVVFLFSLAVWLGLWNLKAEI